MKLRAKVVLLFGLTTVAAAPAAAQQSAGQTPTARPKAPETKERAARATEVEAQIQALRQLVEEQSRALAAQQEQIREQQARLSALEQQIAGARASDAEAAIARAAEREALEGHLGSVAEASQELSGRLDQVQEEFARAQRGNETKLRNLGNFSFNGDLRLRGETFHGGTLATPRIRERFRLRFHANARFGEEWSGGLSLASGDSSNPISSNQSFTNFFQRKFIGIDRAFVSYQPKWAAPLGELTLTGGKFSYTWYNTELTWDNDTHPEGFSQVLSFKLPKGPMERVTLVGFQTVLAEISAGKDTTMMGGQFQTHWKLGDRTRFATYAGFYNYANADRIRAAQISGMLGGNTSSNAGTPTQFASRFGILDLTGRLDVETRHARWPVMVQFNYAINTRACTNLAKISGPPPACNARDRDAYWAEVQFGQTRERGDLLFSYTLLRLERESVVSAFNYSDLRAGTNTVTNRLKVGYQALPNVTLNWTGLFGRQLVTSTSPTRENILRRMQYDIQYRF